ncbi:MAG: hypothetical protein B6247_03970 [Candidatus Parabeggiatoa sp. nov. 2]|nr:MAG: hypothetical protein B6247_03970 [Beggiatoa sp. 4572_84]
MSNNFFYRLSGTNAHMSIEIIKSSMPPFNRLFEHLTQSVNTGIDNIIYWPISQTALLSLYHVSAEHSRSIQIKAEGTFGGGIIGKGKNKIEILCQMGSAYLFVQLGIDLETYGNAFIEITRDGKEQILALSHLPAPTMYRHANLTDYVQIVYLPDGQEKITHFKASEVLHLRLPCPFGSYYALPQWIGANGMLELVEAATNYNAKFFTNHAMPEFAIVTKGSPFSEEQKTAAKEFFQREYQGIENAHRTLVLHISDPESSIEFHPLTSNVKEGDFLKLLDAAKERIQIAHGVPPRLLGIISAGSLAGGPELTAQLFTFEKLTLSPRRRWVRDQLRPLLAELNIAVESINFLGIDLTPPDIDNVNVTNWAQSGIISNEEARALLQIDERQGLSKSQEKLLLNLLKKL